MLRYRLAGFALAAHRIWCRLAGEGAAGFRIPLFHDVPKSGLPAFERLIAYVKEEHGIVSPEAAAAWIDGTAPPTAEAEGRQPCLFSFDDGFQSNFELATTVLDHHSITSLFFVSPGLVEMSGDKQRAAIASGVFDGRISPEQLDTHLQMMTWDQIRELRSHGHNIGCHGMSHRRLSKLTDSELRHEIIAAGELLNTRLGEYPSWYAYPFGDVDSISAEAHSMIGKHYRFCRSGVRGLNTTETPCTAVLADYVPLKAPLAYQKLILEGGLDSRYAADQRNLKRMTEI